MSDNLKPENPDEILDHTLNDDWMLLWYKALLLSDDYRKYCEAIKIDNQAGIAALTNDYDNIADTYKYFGYIYDDVEVIENRDVIGYELASYESAEQGFDAWLEDNGDKVFQLTVSKAEIIREGFPVEPQAGTLYFCKLSSTEPELDAKLQGYLDEAVKTIERKLEKDRRQFTNKPISQLNPEDKSNQLASTERRLLTVATINKHRESTSHSVISAYIELIKNSQLPTWQTRRAKLLKLIKERKIYATKLDELNVDDLGNNYDTFQTEKDDGIRLIKNATNMVFPSIK